MNDYTKSIVGYVNQRAEAKPLLPLADYEKDTIAYFFAKLKLTDQRFYVQAMPDEKTEQITKRDYANQLRYLSNEKIDTGFFELRRLIAANHPEYKFLTIPKAIGLCDGTASVMAQEGIQIGAHKVFEPLAIPDLTLMDKSKVAGRRELDGILSMFESSDTKPEAVDEKLEKIKRGEI